MGLRVFGLLLVIFVILPLVSALHVGSIEKRSIPLQKDFGTAIDEACRTLDAISNGDQTAELQLSDYMTDSVMARGLFVSLLATDDRRGALAEHPALIDAVLQAQDAKTVADLSVMNLIMPTATAILHERNGHLEAQAASQATKQRAKSLLVACHVNEVSTNVAQRQRAHLEALQTLFSPLADQNDENKELMEFWINFCQKWDYDEKQRAAILSAVNEVVLLYEKK
mmetsp:Transcript_20780/g.31775  ORF Transcript_20780/g.31775 Transcript_20780/m.31775 type:complete len:226 (+) Transcript_20780:80-757(+)